MICRMTPASSITSLLMVTTDRQWKDCMRGFRSGGRPTHRTERRSSWQCSFVSRTDLRTSPLRRSERSSRRQDAGVLFLSSVSVG